MFHKILVAVDRSPMGKQVFAEALSLARSVGASLVLVNILSLEEEECPNMPALMGPNAAYPGGISSSVMEIYQELWQSYAERGLRLLRSLAEEAATAGVPTEILQGIGSPGSTLCELAQTAGADLIVMGRRQHSRLNELLLGSTSNYALHHAPCSVLVVQGRPSPSPVHASEQVTSVTQEGGVLT
ncbi:universal stress protein [Leptodesmis sichuanensis]|jgi:nucleotide-binding universal stress UspA family protein|uniref:universal stress protein n=1 Tax=Leptodesmis sichuanensis TaxID=2906798 RepID=UPI001F43B7A2|nr:universal stress protein [Leptodesmis sichuanensis]UIE40000.1 universal stress protein [Leptodesmis sichuanensis A121]